MSSSIRVRSVDFLRLTAALQMVEGHTIDALLAPEYRHGRAYALWIALRGLTSVAFLLAAGLSFQLATLRNVERHLSEPGAVSARFTRAGMLVLLGYLLRLPLPMPVGEADFAAAIDHALATDVLQCIGISLALLELLVVLLRRAVRIEIACALLGIAMLALAPACARIDPRGPFLPLLDYLTPRAGSLFPLLPWSAHMFIGVALARHLLGKPRSWLRLAFAAGSARALASAAKLAGLTLAADHLGRLSFVLLSLCLLTAADRLVRHELPRLTRLAGETLFVYAFHVLLVYGRDLGLGAVIGARLSPFTASLVALAMIGLSFGCALAYRRVWSGLAHSAATG